MTKSKAKAKTVTLELTPQEATCIMLVCEDYEQVCNDRVTVRRMTSVKKKIQKTVKL